MAEWYWDADEFTQAVNTHGSVAAAARATGIPRATLQHWAMKHNVLSSHANNRTTSRADTAHTPPGASFAGDTATVTLPNHPKREGSRTPNEVLRDHGLNVDEWDVQSYSDNYWQGSDGDGPAHLTQSKVIAKRRVPSAMALPARTDTPLRRYRIAPQPIAGAPLLIALPSDQHCPHQDPDLEACWLAWLSRNQPGRILGLGDILNLSKPSRHRANLHAKHNDEAAANYQAGHDWWRRTIAAAPDAECGQLPGNHDLRASIACLEKLPDLYNVKRPGEQYAWHDLEYMLGLDKLGVTYHRPEGEYHAAEVHLAKGLSVTHGASAGPVGGAVKDARKHEGSRVVGHDHTQAITHVVRYRDGEARLHVAVSAGTMARRDLGYTPTPDAEQGFATVTLHTNGQWNVELARYDARRKTLHWRDQMYHA